MHDMLFNYPNLDIRAASVFDLSVDRSPRDGESSYYASGMGSIAGLKLGASPCLSPLLVFIDRHMPLLPRHRRDNIMLQCRHLHWDVFVRRDTYR